MTAARRCLIPSVGGVNLLAAEVCSAFDSLQRGGTLVHKSIAISLLAALTLFAIQAVSVTAAVIPPIGLAPGSQYQLIFVTADTRRADSADIGSYNTFVTGEAALNPALPQGVTWNAVASSLSGPTEAILNAPSGVFVGNIPVYNTMGLEVSDGSGYGVYGPLSGTGAPLLNPVKFDQFGNPSTAGGPNNFVWTGSIDNGRGDTYLMGSSEVMTGSPYMDTGWLKTGVQRGRDEQYHLYALSSPITVPVPEQSTFVLGGLGALGLLAVARCSVRLRPGA
jgi:hypothetical protein